jgi:cytosine/adenosine deaminase-related metal-dependent hydrolase
VGYDAWPEILWANTRVAARFFDEPLLGQLAVGAPADIAVADAPVRTPLTTENLFACLVYGVAEAPVRHTVARGALLMEDFRLLTIDTEDTAEQAREIAPRVWERFASMPPPER